MSLDSDNAVLFIAFGGPEKQEDIRPFLEIVTRGRGIPAERLEAVAHHYEAIGGGSPINAITRRQAAGVERRLAERGQPLKVYIGQRNWHPFLKDTLERMVRDGIRRACGFIASAHRTEASIDRYIQAVDEARTALGPSAPSITYVAPWHDHPQFIDGIAARVDEALQPLSPDERAGLSWVFTAHSVPRRMADQSPYVAELRRTAELTAARFQRSGWRLVYTSRSGSPRDPWLEPDISDEIRDQARRGVRSILVIPIGFIADHVEVLYDLDIEAKAAADAAGVRLLRAQTVNDHPAFLDMITDLIQTAAVGSGGRPSCWPPL